MRPRSIDPLLTTYDARRLLNLSASGVRWLVAQGQLQPAERLLNGQSLFRKSTVLELVITRAMARHPRLAGARPRMARARLAAGQLALPLTIAHKAKGALRVRTVKVLDWPKERTHVA